MKALKMELNVGDFYERFTAPCIDSEVECLDLYPIMFAHVSDYVCAGKCSLMLHLSEACLSGITFSACADARGSTKPTP